MWVASNLVTAFGYAHPCGYGTPVVDSLVASTSGPNPTFSFRSDDGTVGFQAPREGPTGEKKLDAASVVLAREGGFMCTVLLCAVAWGTDVCRHSQNVFCVYQHPSTPV